MPPAIETHQLTKRFGTTAAVQDLNLTVEPGTIVGFLGPNGAGKTTTLAMLLHLLRPTSGRAIILGHDVWQQPDVALRHVGALIESPAFYSYLSGRENLRALARADGLSDTIVDQQLEVVGLTNAAKARFQTYSQGMRQRLALAAALMREPKVLLLDEPLNGLDPNGVLAMRNLLRQLCASGVAILLSSHQLAEVQHICDEVAVLKAGRLIAAGPVTQLLAGEGGLALRVASDPLAALELVKAQQGVRDAGFIGDQIFIDVPVELAPQINAALVGAGVAVAELRRRELLLEEFFLRITSEEAAHV